MNKCYGVIATWLIISIICGATTNAQTETEVTESKGKMSELFNEVIVAEGNDYFRVRNQLLEQTPQAEPYLEEQTESEKLETRVTARAVLCWMRNMEMNRQRTEVLLALTYYALHMKSGPASEVVAMARVNGTGRTGRGGDRSRYFPSYDDAAPFLIEAALRGLDPEHNEFQYLDRERRKLDLERHKHQEVVQACAAALLVGSEDKDVIEVFKVLYETGGRTMRRVAAIGLARAGIETDEPIEDRVRWSW